MQLEFLIPLVLFLNILRLWGRSKVHSPPTPFPTHYNSFFFLTFCFSPRSSYRPPSHVFLPSPPFLANRASPPMALRGHCTGSLPHTDLALFLVSLVLRSSWCSFSRWGVGNRIAMGFLGTFNCFLFVCSVFSTFIYKNTKHSISANQKSYLPTEHY